MKLSIHAYGSPVLKKQGEIVPKDYEGLDELIANMWETMYNASGVGLAAPQIGLSLRLFVVDSRLLFPEEEQHFGIKKVFINGEKIEEGGAPWAYEEGCLSIPEVRGDVVRPAQIKFKFFDENWNEHEEVFSGLNARVIQHEYDHTKGLLFTEQLKPLKKKMIKRKLMKIKAGNIEPEYKMKFFRKGR